MSSRLVERERSTSTLPIKHTYYQFNVIDLVKKGLNYGLTYRSFTRHPVCNCISWGGNHRENYENCLSLTHTHLKLQSGVISIIYGGAADTVQLVMRN